MWTSLAHDHQICSTYFPHDFHAVSCTHGGKMVWEMNPSLLPLLQDVTEPTIIIKSTQNMYIHENHSYCIKTQDLLFTWDANIIAKHEPPHGCHQTSDDHKSSDTTFVFSPVTSSRRKTSSCHIFKRQKQYLKILRSRSVLLLFMLLSG